MRIELAIISGLVTSEEYLRKVSPFLKDEYFQELSEKLVIKTCLNFYEKYSKPATKEVLMVELNKRNDITEDQLLESINLVEAISNEYDKEWLVVESEEFCKKRALVNAIYESMYIMEGKDKTKTVDSLPKLLSDALAVSFDNSIGHDYIEDASNRFDFYHLEQERLPFDIDLLNEITGGGLVRKSLTCLLASTGSGKSLSMVHFAASNMRIGKNVLYITMEMAEERIAERIDANMFNVPIQDIKHIKKETYDSKVKRISEKTQGRLIVKEYPTGSAHAGHFRALIEELKGKKDFKPDVIYIDYLNICASQRVKNTSANSYTIVKSIAEELRGLAMEYDVPIVTATQVVRSGINASDLDMGDTSDSIGLAYTLDLFLALITTEELEELNQIMIKQLKNRYNDVNHYKKFMVGIDKSRMKLYNTEKQSQDNITGSGKKSDDKPLFDSSTKPTFTGFKFQ